MARSRREVLDKVVKMLRLARRAGTEAEAHTALTLAQKLMYAHGLDARDVEGSEDEREIEPIEESMIDHAASRLGWREYLAAVVAENFRCAYIISVAKPGAVAKAPGGVLAVRLVFVGRELDVAAASEAYRSAAVAGETLAEGYVDAREEAGRAPARDAYLSGFLAGLDRRLRANVAETALALRLEDAVLEHARALTNADDAVGSALPTGDREALRTGFDEGFAFGDRTKRIE